MELSQVKGRIDLPLQVRVVAEPDPGNHVRVLRGGEASHERRLVASLEHWHGVVTSLEHERLRLRHRSERVDRQLAIDVGRPLMPDRHIRRARLDLSRHLADRPLRAVGDHDHVNRLAFVRPQHLSLRLVHLAH